jgi:hypothetical protein
MNLFSIKDAFNEFVARLSGPMSMRFILQPLIAIILGIRDGIKDAKLGNQPFILDLVFNPQNRKRDIKSAFKSLLTPIIIGTLLDAIVQYLMFKYIRPLAALLVGAFVMGIPYALARGVSNRIASLKNRGK